MRVAFSGASGTGKTTLAKWLSEVTGWPINPVGSRSVAKSMGFDSPYDVDAAGKRREFQTKLQMEKVAWEMDHEHFITDRSTLDELTYTTLHLGGDVDDTYFERAMRHTCNYHHVFLLGTITFLNLEDDPARKNSFRYQWLFDTLLFGLNKVNHARSVQELKTGDLEERKRLISDALML